MASDLSHIIKKNISSTLESLLSITTTIDETEPASNNDLIGKQCISVDVDIEFSKYETTKFKFYIPSLAATKFEYFMLGGIGDLKDTIDDEIADAINEIVSNMCGSISTDINAQDFSDLGSMKFTINSSEIIQCENINSLESTFKFNINLDDDKLMIFIEFDPSFLVYLSAMINDEDTSDLNNDLNISQDNTNAPTNAIFSLLGEDSIENLKLLFDIKFKLSVRLGTKTLLLKDITSWDTGTIIELEQMVNEPLDILANGIKIGIGEAVIIEGKFGIKIKQIGNEKIN